MIVDELNVVGVAILPAEADAPLVVDADTMLASTITLELFKPVAWWHTEVSELLGSINGNEFPEHRALKISRILANRFSAEQPLGIPIPETLNHPR
jgi:hypothetical protein